MIIDRDVLRWADPEALARLARSLRLELPPIPRRRRQIEVWRADAEVRIAAVTDPAPATRERAGAS